MDHLATKILTCRCGRRSKEFDDCGSVSDTAQRSGFMFVASHTGGLIWLCRECYEKVHRLAKQINEIVKDEYLHFTSLLRSIKAI